MPRVHHVKRAQQRYATKPVIDPATGTQKVVPVTSRKTGEPRTTKSGRAIVKRLTERDLSRPLDMPTCDAPGCGKPIEVGTPYKHISPKSGPYGGRTRYRHESCPTWQPWDYSNSLGTRLQQISHEFHSAADGADTADDIKSALDDAAQAVRDLADEKRESADNMEQGFGHSTYQSEELAQQADDLETWADEIEQVDVPAMEDFPCEECQGSGEQECHDCGGTGREDDDPSSDECDGCAGAGTLDCENCDESNSDPDAWRDAVEDAVSIVDEAPL